MSSAPRLLVRPDQHPTECLRRLKLHLLPFEQFLLYLSAARATLLLSGGARLCLEQVQLGAAEADSVLVDLGDQPLAGGLLPAAPLLAALRGAVDLPSPRPIFGHLDGCPGSSIARERLREPVSAQQIASWWNVSMKWSLGRMEADGAVHVCTAHL